MDELKTIVQRMIDAGESEENIKLVIERYQGKVQGSTVDPTMSQESMGSQLESGSSELPEDKGWFEDMWTAIRGGSAAGSSVGEAFDVYRQGRNISDEDLQRYIEAAKLVEQNPETNEAASWKRDMKKHGGGFLGGFMGLLENPGYFPQFVASSAATMATSFLILQKQQRQRVLALELVLRLGQLQLQLVQLPVLLVVLWLDWLVPWKLV